MFVPGVTNRRVSVQNINEDFLKLKSIVEVELDAPDTTGVLTIDYVAPFRFARARIQNTTYNIESVSNKHNI